MAQHNISQTIHDLRIARGMTLEQVASIVGVGKSTVRKWETGMIANMKRDKIAALAVALGTTPAVLMGWKEKDISTEEMTLTEREKKLLDLFRSLPEEKQTLALQMIQVALGNQE